MSGKKLRITTQIHSLDTPKIPYTAPSNVNSAIPEDELCQSAKHLLIYLNYIEQKAKFCNFDELAIFVEAAHISALELIQSLDEG